MITLRGQRLSLQPLSLKESDQVIDSLLALKACNPPDEMLRPAHREHLLAVITVAVRRFIPDATPEEVEDALDLVSLGYVLMAISGQLPAHTHQEVGHA